MLTSLILFSLAASADVRFEGFAWRADNTFEMHISSPIEHTFKGALLDAYQAGAKRIEMVQAPVKITIKAVGNSFVVVTLIEDGQEFGQVIILERQNGRYVEIQTAPISGRVVTLVADLDGSLEGLKKTNNWDSALSLRAMVGYFESNSGKRLHDFYDAVELGHIKTVARPVETAARSAARSRNFRVPDSDHRDDYVYLKQKEREERRRQAAEESQRRLREPKPYEPRHRPPGSDYPGQNIRSRSFDGPPRRRGKTPFELMFDL